MDFPQETSVLEGALFSQAILALWSRTVSTQIADLLIPRSLCTKRHGRRPGQDAIKLPFPNSRCPDQVPQRPTCSAHVAAALSLVCLTSSPAEASKRVLRANCPDYDGSETPTPISTSQASTSGSYDEVIKASSASPGGSSSSDASASESGDVTVGSLTTSSFSSATESTASDPEEVSVETLSLASSASEESKASDLDETTVDTPEPTTGFLSSAAAWAAASTASGSEEVSVEALSLASSASDSNDAAVDTPEPTTVAPTSTSWQGIVTLYSETDFGGSTFKVAMTKINRCYVLDCFDSQAQSATWDAGLPTAMGNFLSFFGSADCKSDSLYQGYGTFYYANLTSIFPNSPAVKAIALWTPPFDDPTNPVSTCPA